ncbi:LysR family transcriptional regulator [Anaerosphaera multitolerans]|uniref:LysR family transcriptional regulator n=1 Tax=Anaerosphaera multitolerans TaxID=2487351 RepID=A0A437S543_9FIRM|nr:LysR family transcriptional regulator [Anaerosphaera multitolerans]RVU54145.1 LysR family transcriptional regulator [Anaerosphaera multitolerans]
MFKGIEYVYEVYLEKSFSKAAKNLFISQPSLSAAIKKIELEIGFDIFDRTTKPIGLTEFGLEYIKSLEKILEIEENFNNYLQDLSDLQAGSISIGGTNLFTSYILPPILSEFSNKYPKVKLNIIETNTAELEKYLYNGSLDLVIDNYDFDSSVYERNFYSKDNIMLAVPAKFESNNRVGEYQIPYEDIKSGKYLDESVKTLPLKTFKDEPFLFLKEGNDTRIRAEKICVRENVKPNILLELDQQMTCFNLTCFGMGVSFVSDILLKNVGENKEIYIYKLETFDSAREVSFYYKKFKYLKKATQEFLKIANSIKI